MLKLKYYTTVLLLLCCSWIGLSAQKWDIPADKSARNSHIPFTPATAKQGEDLYNRNCASCHGNPGKANSLKSLSPVPADMASTQTQQRTDGDLFYIISIGRQVMPSFANVLSEEERWKVVSYIRSFNKEYVQVLSKFDPEKAKLVRLTIDYDSVNFRFKVMAKAHEKSGIIPLRNDEVSLAVNRYFGKLYIGKTLRTDNNGEVVFDFPKDLPGDKDGVVNVVVKVSDDNYGEVETAQKMKIGVPTDRPSLTKERAMWNVVWKAPIWLLILYPLALLGVLSCFGYIFYNLYRIQKAGKN